MMIPDRKDTSLLRFMAILLITNSHLDSLYPVPYIGTGGAIGNSLFFMLSGYGLALSGQINDRPFLQWYWRRILRIYPSLILVVAITDVWLRKGWQNWAWSDYLINFVWPTPAWFVSALMIFYIVFFIVMKIGRPEAYLMPIIALFIPYFYFYFTTMDLTQYTIEGPSYFKWIFYLQVMLFGGYLASYTKKIKGSMIKDSFLLFGCIVLYYGILLFVSRGYGGQFQAVTQLLMFPIMFLFLKVSRSQFIIHNLMSTKYVGAAISQIAILTLEIYLVHGAVYSHPSLQPIRFPANLIIFWIAVISTSFVINRATHFIPQKHSVASYKKHRLQQ
ncbi:acyltransferase family protein [Thermodesulfobacteriota bacterium]